MPRCQDLAIFVLMTTDNRQTKLIASLLAAYAHGVIIMYMYIYTLIVHVHVFSEKVTYNCFDFINLTSQLIDA